MLIHYALLFATLVAGTLPAVASPAIPAGIPIDEQYRQKFAACDSNNTFDGVRLPISRNGKIVWYGCRTNPSHFEKFDRVAAGGAAPGAVIVDSKLGLDEDGSWKACHRQGGPTDQCTTSLMLQGTAKNPCPPIASHDGYCLPLDADHVPYVVIPHSAPAGIDGGAFSRLSKLNVGDYGVVIVGDRVVPVIIGDAGPAYKIGEGSNALLSALASDGKPHTIDHGVTFVLFPGTRESRAALSADTLLERIREKAMPLYRQMTQQH
jgi:hypothetical protein